jgi:excisionase family DNA binding protein
VATEPIVERQSEPVLGQLLYPIPQGARVLGISARLLWTFVQRGEIRTRRVGARVLIHRRELEKFALHDHSTLKPEVEAI